MIEGETVHLEVQRSGGTLGDIVIGWEIENAGSDLSPSSGQVLMKVGERSAAFSVVARNDSVCLVTNYLVSVTVTIAFCKNEYYFHV